jgi:exodeoxyribonuclease VII large subunit
VEKHRTRLHQQLREIRAAGRRRADAERLTTGRRVAVLDRKAVAARAAAARGEGLDRLRMALDARDPQRTLDRGYALVEGADGSVVTTAEAARAAREIRLRFGDGSVDATIRED